MGEITDVFSSRRLSGRSSRNLEKTWELEKSEKLEKMREVEKFGKLEIWRKIKGGKEVSGKDFLPEFFHSEPFKQVS